MTPRPRNWKRLSAYAVLSPRNTLSTESANGDER